MLRQVLVELHDEKRVHSGVHSGVLVANLAVALVVVYRAALVSLEHVLTTRPGLRPRCSAVDGAGGRRGALSLNNLLC